MGGYGSGQYYRSKEAKAKVEDCIKLDANVLARSGLFKPGNHNALGEWSRNGGKIISAGLSSQVFENYASLTISHEGNRLHITLCWYAPGFGGRRYSFECPLCNKPVRTLFYKYERIACRNCHNLTYLSCIESHKYDIAYKLIADSIRDDGWNISPREIKHYLSLGRRLRSKTIKRKVSM